MTRQRQHHREAVRVVAGAVEPRVHVGIDHDGLVALAAGDHRDAVLRFQVGTRLALQADLRSDLVLQPRLGRMVEHVLQEVAVTSAEVEARVSAVSEVPRSLVPRETNEIEHTDSATLDELR